MFVGHLAVGLAAKRIAPRTSLGTLTVAAILPDLLVWALVVAGVEHIAITPGITTTNPLDLYDYPISHSLVMDFIWGALLGGGYYLARKYSRGSMMIFAAVMSHWVLDFISHRPDMPLAPGLQRYYGLGLFNSRMGMIVVEGLLWVIGIAIYLSATRPKKPLGRYVFGIGVALITWMWLNSLKGVAPPGGDVVRIGIASLILMCVLIAWAFWIEHLRTTIITEVPARTRVPPHLADH